MTIYEKSAIVGMYRMGASFTLIGAYFDVDDTQVFKIVLDYIIEFRGSAELKELLDTTTYLK